MPTFLTPQEVKLSGLVVKFVRVAGVYRFFDGELHKHSEAVTPQEKPEAAGTITIWPTFVRMEDPYSTTLRIGALQEHYSEIEAILGLPLKARWED